MLFFGSNSCVKCGKTTGMCPTCQRVVPLEVDDSSVIHCGQAGCAVALWKCSNFASENICNRMMRADGDAKQTRCEYCRLTTVMPLLSIEGNQQKWRRLERAKHRVLYMLDTIGLPFRPSGQPGEPILSFEFKADGEKPVHTGHNNGCITINLREADSVEREKARKMFREPQRTLVGHYRHELGHYFWDRLVKGICEEEFRASFGDERTPSYATALKGYYANGPQANWRKSFVSAYATMHPWEDFAETFNLYLDMVSVLDTARHFAVSNASPTDDLATMVKNYQRVGVTANEFNRDMGLIDLVPEVIVQPLIEKLKFIHSLVPQQN